MKIFRNLLNSVHPLFEKGGKLEQFHPAYDAFESFLFVPGKTAQSGAHIRDAIDLKRTMITVVIALIPCLLFGIWNTGHQHFVALGQISGIGEGFMDKFLFGLGLVLPLIIVSYGTGLTCEFIFAIIKKHQVNEGFLVSGMLIPLVMPCDIPLWMVAVATIFAVVIGKEVFGGTGMNVLNPALTARAFLFFAYPTKMSGNDVWINVPRDATWKATGVVDGYTGATALGDAAARMPLHEIEAKYSMFDAFWGFIPGSIGETSAFCCLIGAAILLITGIGSWRIMVSMLFGGLLMAYIFNIFGLNPLMQINPLHHILLGGFMFGMVFMATDPVSAAQTNTGKYIYGFLIGMFAILIRIFNPAYPEGVMMAILLMNVIAPLIDHFVIEANINRRLKRIKVLAK